ncbi:unnamed protein product [Caenorhabditis angaria]|uniref:Uncharacterized protein n=1 Tax=Caenorhabditis angaria TaxID=860376 RepID=A0A9P1IQZ5_9PELO|nr:unnamed protein product [Caenorhabditis angaria]
MIFKLGLLHCKDSVPDGKLNSMNHVKMSDKQINKFQQLHYGWYIQAVSSLLGSVGKQMYMKMKKPERRAFVACLDAIEKEHDVKAGAKCLVKAFDGKLEKEYKNAQLDPKLNFIDKQFTVPMTKLDIKKVARKAKQNKIVKSIVNKKANGIIKKMHADKIKSIRYRKKMRKSHAEDHGVSQKMLDKLDKINRRMRIKRSILSLYSNKDAADEAKRVDKADRGVYRPRNAETAPSLIDSKKSPVKIVTNLVRQIVKQNETKTMEGSYGSLKKLQDVVMDARAKSKFKHRMLDVILGEKNPLRRRKSYSDRLRDITPEGLIDENVYGLVESVSKHSKDVNTNFLSPRFFPIMPDKYQVKKNLLSPSMFPLYKDDSDNSILPLPNVLEKAGLNTRDRDSVLELVMDVSGVNHVVDDALNIVSGLRKEGLDTDLFDMSSLIDTTYQSLAKSMTKSQNLDFANQKFSYMNGEQMRMLYGEKGVYNTSLAELPFDVNEVENLSMDQKIEALRLTIRNIAKGKESYFLSPTVFSPQAFAPAINQLSVLGPLVISPQLFCPSVLSPLLLSPPVISPQVGNPLIFSPYVLGPNVLSAAVFNAYVFSPYVLSPNVINPYVMSPLILSPFVLCPDVLSPTVLSGAILSPSVLSPSVFTDSVLAANVLSPTFLS